MPIRDRITWGLHNPFSDPRLAQLDTYVKAIRTGRMPASVKGGRVFHNDKEDLPAKPPGHYREYDVEAVEPGKARGRLRLVLGHAGEVYITGDHYGDFRQITNMPL